MTTAQPRFDPRTESILAAHAIEVDQTVEVSLPGAGLSGQQVIAGRVSSRSTRSVLVLDRAGAKIVDRIPWSTIWVIRTRDEDVRA